MLQVVIAILSGFAVLSVLFYQPFWLILLLEHLVPDVVWRLPPGSESIALTFDDGPDPTFTPQVLDLLSAHSAKASFFVAASNAALYPQLIARMKAEHHLVCNHLRFDRSVLFKSEASLERDLLAAQQYLSASEEAKFVRPPRALFGSAFRRIARKHGYTIVLGSAYASDPYRPPSGFIAWSIGKMLRPRAIVVMHDAGGNRKNTVTALSSILRTAAEKRLSMETLSVAYRRERRHF